MPKLEAKPRPLEIDLTKSAVVVVDMQNPFASKGGMLDIAGVDISDAPRVVQSIKKEGPGNGAAEARAGCLRLDGLQT
jgi:ureidoacrylate peracid hydrolase